MADERITLSHGSGGADAQELMRAVFAKHFDNEVLARLEDAAVINTGPGTSRIAVSTDTFVVRPLVFPGGDIGKLAVCGTVNDVLMSGAEPKALTCGFVIEAGLPIELLDRICASMAAAAKEAGVFFASGDTKVIEGRAIGAGSGENAGGGLIINTTGIGVFPQDDTSEPALSKYHAASGGIADDLPGNARAVSVLPSPGGLRPGDALLVSGNLGDHHACILSARMNIQNSIESDCALLAPIIHALRDAGIPIHAMRDITRGGLGTILNELATASGAHIEIEEKSIPVSLETRAFCGVMGLDPLYMGNEGKMVLVVAQADAENALARIRAAEIGRNAVQVGVVLADGPIADPGIGTDSFLRPDARNLPPVVKRTSIGGLTRVDVLFGEGLPRIC
jgi:hydrogenase expression/formation protein HypE